MCLFIVVHIWADHVSAHYFSDVVAGAFNRPRDIFPDKAASYIFHSRN
jgi:hypothetical protein